MDTSSSDRLADASRSIPSRRDFLHQTAGIAAAIATMTPSVQAPEEIQRLDRFVKSSWPLGVGSAVPPTCGAASRRRLPTSSRKMRRLWECTSSSAIRLLLNDDQWGTDRVDHRWDWIRTGVPPYQRNDSRCIVRGSYRCDLRILSGASSGGIGETLETKASRVLLSRQRLGPGD